MWVRQAGGFTARRLAHAESVLPRNSDAVRSYRDIRALDVEVHRRLAYMIGTIRGNIHELETGEPTAGRIDITVQSVEVQFGVACSHLQGGARVALPVADRSLYIPGG